MKRVQADDKEITTNYQFIYIKNNEMKVRYVIAAFLTINISLVLVGCSQKDIKNQKMEQSDRTPIASLEEIKTFVSENFNDYEETLWISESLNDQMGANMAIVTSIILNVGYMPDGFEQKDGYRIYRYKKEH